MTASGAAVPHTVLHAPHSAVEIPAEYRRAIVLPKAKLRRELFRMTDAFCDELYADATFPVRIVAPVSRLVCDMERFRDDADEPCAKEGRGLMPVRTSRGERLRENGPALREKILLTYYDPHHARLTAAVAAALAENGRCTILDGHSFSNTYPFRWDCLLRRPDVCIGTDPFHTPDGLRDALVQTVRDAGLDVRLNTPYAGAITPICYYGRDRRVSSVMVELNKRLYLNEKTMEKTADFAAAHALCQRLMRAAHDWQA